MKKSMVLSAVIVMFLLCITGAASALNLIQNGDFGTGNLAPYWIETGNPGPQAYVDGNGRAILNDNNGDGTSGIYQNFYIGPDTETLSISFQYIFGGIDSSESRDDNFLSRLSLVEYWFMIGDYEVLPEWHVAEQLVDQDSGLNPSNVHVYNFSTQFTIPSNLSSNDPNGRISFLLSENSRSSTDTWIALDNVVVDDGAGNGSSPVPEPATLLLLGSGLLGLAGFRKKSK